MHKLKKMALLVCIPLICQCSSPSGSDSTFIDEVMQSCFSTESYDIPTVEEKIIGYLDIPLKRQEDAVTTRHSVVEIQSPICGSLHVNTDLSEIQPKLDKFLTAIVTEKTFSQNCDYDCAARESALIPFTGRWEKSSKDHSEIIILDPVKFAEPVDFIAKFGGVSKVEAYILTRRIEKQMLLDSLNLN